MDPGPTTWSIHQNDGEYHCVPDMDYREHVIGDCWCRSYRNPDGLIIHPSMDGREAFEAGKRKMS
jgi:hypothetical protein